MRSPARGGRCRLARLGLKRPGAGPRGRTLTGGRAAARGRSTRLAAGRSGPSSGQCSALATRGCAPVAPAPPRRCLRLALLTPFFVWLHRREQEERKEFERQWEERTRSNAGRRSGGGRGTGGRSGHRRPERPLPSPPSGIGEAERRARGLLQLPELSDLTAADLKKAYRAAGAHTAQSVVLRVPVRWKCVLSRSSARGLHHRPRLTVPGRLRR